MWVHEDELGGHDSRQHKHKVEEPCRHQVVHKDHVVDDQHQLLIHYVRDVIIIEDTVFIVLVVLILKNKKH